MNNEFVNKLHNVLVGKNLNDKETKNLQEACKIVDDLIHKIKESEDKIKKSEDKIKESEDKIKEAKEKIKILNLKIKKKNKE